MSFLLDTNICSAHMRRPAGLAHRFFQHAGRLAIPTIVLAELYAGAHMTENPDQLLEAINDLLADVEVIDIDNTAALAFGKLRGDMKRQGLATNPMDLLIASVAIAHDLTLVTENTRDFSNIPGLRLENWLED